MIVPSFTRLVSHSQRGSYSPVLNVTCGGCSTACNSEGDRGARKQTETVAHEFHPSGKSVNYVPGHFVTYVPGCSSSVVSSCRGRLYRRSRLHRDPARTAASATHPSCLKHCVEST